LCQEKTSLLGYSAVPPGLRNYPYVFLFPPTFLPLPMYTHVPPVALWCPAGTFVFSTFPFRQAPSGDLNRVAVTLVVIPVPAPGPLTNRRQTCLHAGWNPYFPRIWCPCPLALVLFGPLPHFYADPEARGKEKLVGVIRPPISRACRTKPFSLAWAPLRPGLLCNVPLARTGRSLVRVIPGNRAARRVTWTPRSRQRRCPGSPRGPGGARDSFRIYPHVASRRSM